MAPDQGGEARDSSLLLDRHLLAPHALRRWAVAAPDRLALQHVDGPALTYSELDAQARKWADGLRRLGVEAGTHVGTFLTNQFDSFRVMLGLAWLKAVEVPLNSAYTGSLLEYAIGHADVTTLVTAGDLIGQVSKVAPLLPLLDTVVVLDRPSEEAPIDGVRVVDRAGLLDGAAAVSDLEGPECWDVAALLYTSGTTGPSKAVVLPWGAIYQNWSWVPADAFGPGEGLHCAFPLFHNSGRSGFNGVLARGGRFVMRDRFSANHVWDEVRRTDCAALALVGPLTALLYSAPPRHDDLDNPVRSVILGPMIPEMAQFEKRFGVRVCVAYGQTEVGCPVTSGWDHGPPASCGRARSSYPWPEVRIVDEYDRPLNAGQTGEMIVRAAAPWTLNLGYYKMPAETVSAWRNGWFHTGDVFRYDTDGQFYFVDRLKDAIRRRGENISSYEVEKHVSEHPAVLECAVVGVPTTLGDEEILAVVILEEGAELGAVELIEYLEGRMPAFMIPRYLEMVDYLPRSETTGRVRKQLLRERGLTPDTWDREAPGG
jgi:crotonobetaine/carnitine-CoA ligase